MNVPCESIRLLTFNILVDRGDEDPHPWKSRREGVFSLLEFHAPDIFCLQEPLLHQVKDFINRFSYYDHFCVGSRDGEHAGEHLSIFFLAAKFKLLESGKYALADTPEKTGSIGWDAKSPRLVVWVKLFHRDTSTVFYIMNTHFDHIGEEARQKSALLLIQKAQSIAHNFPVLICGDFNASTNSQSYKNIISGGFTDIADDFFAISRDLPYTYHRFMLNRNSKEIAKYYDDSRVLKIIDHIFYKGEIKVLRRAIIDDHFKENYPSDHFPKMCDLIIGNTAV